MNAAQFTADELRALLDALCAWDADSALPERDARIAGRLKVALCRELGSRLAAQPDGAQEPRV